MGNSLEIPQLGLQASTAGGKGWITGQVSANDLGLPQTIEID